jgi:hypothetical protein
MNKFIISTPGRTASTSFFNYVEKSLKESDPSAITIDRGLYSFAEWDEFNSAKTAVFTTFNPFNFPAVLKAIDPADWCLIVLSRKDFTSWLLSMNVTHATSQFHPGKQYKANSLLFKQDEFMSSYWYYKCWTRMIYNQADTFNFSKVVYVDFNELISGWSEIGNRVNGWVWPYCPELMQLGSNASWEDVTNLDEVLTWIPDPSIIKKIRSSL